MKRKLTAAEWAALETSNPLKVMYVLQADGSYQLPLLDFVDPGPIERARDREKQDASDLRTENGQLKEKITLLEKDTPKDVQTLTTAHNAAITTLKTDHDKQATKLKSQLEKSLLSNAANKLAGELTATKENAAIMLPHVSSRLTVEWNGDEATLKIKNVDGSMGAALSDQTMPTLKKEFVDNAQFAAIVVKSQASGGGAASASPGGAGGAGSPRTQQTGDKKWSEMTGAEKVELQKTNPTLFKQLSEADRAEKRKPLGKLTAQ